MHAPTGAEVEEKQSNLMANFALFEPLVGSSSKTAFDRLCVRSWSQEARC
jgi:hypothetical protein